MGCSEGPPAQDLDVALFLMWLLSKGGDGEDCRAARKPALHKCLLCACACALRWPQDPDGRPAFIARGGVYGTRLLTRRGHLTWALGSPLQTHKKIHVLRKGKNFKRKK